MAEDQASPLAEETTHRSVGSKTQTTDQGLESHPSVPLQTDARTKAYLYINTCTLDESRQHILDKNIQF